MMIIFNLSLVSLKYILNIDKKITFRLFNKPHNTVTFYNLSARMFGQFFFNQLMRGKLVRCSSGVLTWIKQ